MAYAPERKTEAYELYLLGNAPGQIADELKRRHPDENTPSAKTVEKWAYVPLNGRTWSERRYAAEAEAMDSATKDFVSMKSNLLAGTARIQAKMQQRAERALDNADDAEVSNLTQEIYALVNVTKNLDKMLDSTLAEEARRKDAIDCLIESCRRIVPGWEALEPKIRAEFQKLVNAKEGP